MKNHGCVYVLYTAVKEKARRPHSAAAAESFVAIFWLEAGGGESESHTFFSSFG